MGYKFVCNNLDLSQIASSGQCFRWKKQDDDSYIIPAFEKILNIRQNGNNFICSCSEEDFNTIWKSYFDIDCEVNYEKIGKIILESNDEYLKSAYTFGSGIRILNQDLWEIIVSFIISQNNNIKRISNSIELICQKNNGNFPKIGEVSGDFFLDKSLGLGYRDVFLKGLYDESVKKPGWILNLKEMNYSEAFNELIKVKGIGTKVANCICLFGLHHVDAFPIDTHIKQILAMHYPDGFDFERYKGFAGIVQQYMFNYKLKGNE